MTGDDLRAWLPLIVTMIGLAVTYGRLSERLTALTEKITKLDAKEDGRVAQERATALKLVELELRFDHLRSDLAKLTAAMLGEHVSSSRSPDKTGA